MHAVGLKRPFLFVLYQAIITRSEPCNLHHLSLYLVKKNARIQAKLHFFV